MRRITLCGLCCLLLAACNIAPPIQPVQPSAVALASPATSPVTAPSAEETSVVVLPLVTGGSGQADTAEATLTPLPSPTVTTTPIATLTPLPTTTQTSVPVDAPVILLARPLANEFVSTEIPVEGKVENVRRGTVLLSLRSPDGRPAGPDPIVASTRVVSDGLAFEGTIAFELPPTPRLFAVYAEWRPEQGSAPVAEAQQLINLLGRYPRVPQLVIESPEPLQLSTDAELTVHGIAPGPPPKVVVRLLDDGGAVLETQEAELDWVQPGLPSTYTATLPNNAAAATVQVLTIGDDGNVTQEARVRLKPKS